MYYVYAYVCAFESIVSFLFRWFMLMISTELRRWSEKRSTQIHIYIYCLCMHTFVCSHVYTFLACYNNDNHYVPLYLYINILERPHWHWKWPCVSDHQWKIHRVSLSLYKYILCIAYGIFDHISHAVRFVVRPCSRRYKRPIPINNNHNNQNICNNGCKSTYIIILIMMK